jgi:hypothetical protein
MYPNTYGTSLSESMKETICIFYFKASVWVIQAKARGVSTVRDADFWGSI